MTNSSIIKAFKINLKKIFSRKKLSHWNNEINKSIVKKINSILIINNPYKKMRTKQIKK